MTAVFHGTPVSLTIHMTARLLEACVDLPTEPAGQLYNRMLGWVGIPAVRRR